MTGEIFSAESFLWSSIWQSTIFLMAGLLGSFLFRRHSARAHRVLFLAMIAAVFVPTASLLVKHNELGVFVAEPVVIKPPSEARVVHEATGRSPVPINQDLHSATAASGDAKVHWLSVLSYAWIAASLILAVRLFVTFVLGVRLLGRSSILQSEKIEQAVHLAKSKLGINKDVRVHSSSRVRSPVIWCWRRRPVLLVPSGAGRFDNRVDWAGVLCHELAHYKRRDHVAGLLAELTICFLPWHPLLWLAKSHLISLSEQACDDWVVASGQPGTDYAESLLNLTPEGQMAFVPAVVSSKRGLAGRVRRILKDNCGNPRTGVVWALTVTIVAACLIILAACAQTRPAKSVTVTTHKEELNNSLLQAARDGDIKQVKSLISKGANVNAANKRGRTALHYASYEGQTDIAKLLIENGADVNASVKDKAWTPLLDAASTGQTEVVKLLLQHGAKVDTGDSYGYTPLIYALWAKDEQSARMLISAGADINKRPNEKEYPALFYTVWEGDEIGTKILIDAGVNVNTEDENGWTPLHHAINGTTQDIINLFVGTGVKIPDFHKAVLEGNLTKVKQLVASGMDVDTPDKVGWTPSYWAVSTGNKEVFNYLLSQGASISAKNNIGRTILLQACHAGFLEIAKQLIAKGADVNATSDDGEHSLGDAALNGHEEVVKLLLASGAEINLNVGRGTALHAAAWNGNSSIVDLLIANGADINVNATNGTPLHLAASANISVADKICSEIVEKLLSEGADVHTKRSRDGRTPLHHAASRDRAQTTKVLISAGAEVSIKDKEGYTPLHYAARRGQQMAAKVLIAAGSDINARNNVGHTPLWYANNNEQREIAELLLTRSSRNQTGEGKRLTP